MLEIFLVMFLATKIGGVAKQKGYKAGGYQLLLVALWIIGEVTGFLVGQSLSEELCATYLVALVGAAIGAGISFWIVNGLKPKIVPKEEKEEVQEPLPTPCKIILRRESSFVGALQKLPVRLNGKVVGQVGNGETISFETTVKSNIITVVDPIGGADLDGAFRFDAVGGETVKIRFKPAFGKVKFVQES